MNVSATIENVNNNEIIDVYGRTFKTLRVSLINTCNLACSYCVDSSKQELEKVKISSQKKALSTNEFIEIIKTLNEILGLDTVRLTGGEPTLYKEIIPLINGIKNAGIENIKMTTNGTSLEKNAVELYNAGLSEINISLDAIDEEISLQMSKRNKLQNVLNGIDNAINVGIKVKINCVVMKGENEHQILKLLEFAKSRNITIRFLELMQMGHLYHNFKNYFFSENEILNTIAAKYNVTALDRAANATAKYFLLNDTYTFGIISNESDPFCNDCNRLRLDSFGNVYGCLSNNNAIDISSIIENKNAIILKLEEALKQKQTKFSGSNLSMLHIGG